MHLVLVVLKNAFQPLNIEILETLPYDVLTKEHVTFLMVCALTCTC